jgi:hypothetical protein
MLDKLNASQRLWLLFAVVFLASSIALIAAAWPAADTKVLADLRAPECGQWRNLPEGQFPEFVPEPGEPCFALRSLLVNERVNLRSEDDYGSYMMGQRAKTALRILGFWAGFAGGAYVLFWAAVRVTKSLLNRGQRKKQAAD